MAAQDKPEKDQHAGEQAGGAGERTSADSKNQTGQSKTEAEEQPETEDERTGRGTGARAGEYS